MLRFQIFKNLLQESILPKIFLCKTKNFPFFSFKIGYFKVQKNIFLCYKHSSLTSKIRKTKKSKFGRIDSYPASFFFSHSLTFDLLWSQFHKNFRAAFLPIHYGTQLMPSVVFLPKNWRHGHVCLQNDFFVVLWNVTAYNRLDVTICKQL